MAGEAEIERKVCKDRISELPDDLLVHILSLVPTKDAVTTMFLSKRWRFVWTMIPKLKYISGETTGVCNFLNKSMQLHRAPLLESLCIRFYGDDTLDTNVLGKWVTYAVERCVRKLNLRFPGAQPQILPTCLYSCTTLVELTLSTNILVDIPSQTSLPSLRTLILHHVVYKDQDSHVKLLSSCPVLKHLHVFRDRCYDNVTSFSVKVPSLERLIYTNRKHDQGGSLFIDSPGLKHVSISAPCDHNCSVQNMPRLDVAFLQADLKEKCLKSFSSVMFLRLHMTKVVYGNAINFSRLIELNICLCHCSDSYSLEALMFLLHNAPKLKVLMIDSGNDSCRILSYQHLARSSWNQPSSVPECLLSHLEVFEWKQYRGRREENQMVAYILANSKYLKTVGISPYDFYSLEEKKKIEGELKSMYKVSSSSQLLFCAQLNWRYYKRENEC